MRAWVVERPGPIAGGPLVLVERPIPEPGPGEVRVAVEACGVCRTDLHLAEGDLAPRRPRTVPGHEAVGIVDAVGSGCARYRGGERVGVAWLGQTCGSCRFCRSCRENLCLHPRFTGWDVDGGFAEYLVADERFVYDLSTTASALEAAPLLCAGIIGYRAYERAQLPPGGRLGLYGFGASAHLTAQLAVASGARVHVQTRSLPARRLALELGAASAQDAADPPPEPLDAAILFAPVGTLVLPALEALDRGGTLVMAGIHSTDIPALDYDRYLFQERTLRSVTANTRVDGETFLRLAERLRVRPQVVEYPFEAADTALRDLAEDRVTGVAVLRVR